VLRTRKHDAIEIVLTNLVSTSQQHSKPMKTALQCCVGN